LTYGSIASEPEQELELEPLIAQDLATQWFLPSENKVAVWSFRFQTILALLLLIKAWGDVGNVLPSGVIWTSFGVVAFGAAENESAG
jgi:hypothetical protein